MSDTYQPIYDAIRSRLGNIDIGAAFSDSVRSEIQGLSPAIDSIRQEFLLIAYLQQAPSAIYRPAIFQDGNQWCALYGENLAEGVAGFGDSPAGAMDDFNKNWNAKLLEKIK